MTVATVHQWMIEQRRLGHVISLILDSEGAREARQSLLQSLGLEHYYGVYHETPISELADAGPFIFLINHQQHACLDALLAAPERHWGWLASLHPNQLSAFTQHWRERIISGTRPNQALYRFHDNRVLARALAFMPEQERPAYLGHAVSVCYWHESHWAVANNPAPGAYPIPEHPAWLNVPAPQPQAIELMHANVYRHLWAEHSAPMASLSQYRDTADWLTEQLAQARHWGWTSTEQVHFLVVHRLNTLERPLIKSWAPRDEETSHTHFERLFNEVKFWSEGNIA